MRELLICGSRFAFNQPFRDPDSRPESLARTFIVPSQRIMYGWAVGTERNRQLALRALERATATYGKLGISAEGMIVHHDRNSVYKSFQWLRQLLMEDQTLVSYAMGGAPDNTVIKSVNGNFKHDNDSLLQDATDIEELKTVVGEQIGYYNNDRRYSSIGYEIPREYAERMAERRDERLLFMFPDTLTDQTAHILDEFHSSKPAKRAFESVAPGACSPQNGGFYSFRVFL